MTSRIRLDILGMEFKDPVFLCLINDRYKPAVNMIQSVKTVAGAIGPLDNLKWGEYQEILVPLAQWPHLAAQEWRRSVAFARTDLATMPNTVAVAPFDATVPDDKCALLDAAIQRCFTRPAARQTEPGIPIVVAVDNRSETDPDRLKHDIRLVWICDAYGQPEQLNLTMVCPLREVSTP